MSFGSGDDLSSLSLPLGPSPRSHMHIGLDSGYFPSHLLDHIVFQFFYFEGKDSEWLIHAFCVFPFLQCLNSGAFCSESVVVSVWEGGKLEWGNELSQHRPEYSGAPGSPGFLSAQG